MVGGPLSSIDTAVERHTDGGIVRPLTDRKRNQVWGVTDVLDELDDLGARIAHRAMVTATLQGERRDFDHVR